MLTSFFFFFCLALGTPLLSSHRHIAVQPQACCPLAAITSLLLPAWRTVSEQTRGHLGDLFQSCFSLLSLISVLDDGSSYSLTCLLRGIHHLSCEPSDIPKSSPRGHFPFLLASCVSVRILSPLPPSCDGGHGPMRSIDGEIKEKKATRESRWYNREPSTFASTNTPK